MSHSVKEKTALLEFWQKHGLSATTLDAFEVKERTLYYWKQKVKDRGELALNDQSKSPGRKRKRQ